MSVDDELLDWLLDEIFKAVPLLNVFLRQAVALWLLAIIKKCFDRATVLQKRKILQMSFTHLLGEDNEH